MSQGFIYNTPTAGGEVRSEPVRLNLNALATFHKGSNPPLNPKLGFSWVDDTNPNNWLLKWYVDNPTSGNIWITVIEHLESSPAIGSGNAPLRTIHFYEGVNAPPMVNIDNYDFNDAAKFENGSVQDIIFRIDPLDIHANGIKLILGYFMTTPHTGNVQLRFDYRIKNRNDLISGGTDYMELVTMNPVDINEHVSVFEGLNVLSGRISNNTELIHCRLSRMGNDISDTHNGDFCLTSIEPQSL